MKKKTNRQEFKQLFYLPPGSVSVSVLLLLSPLSRAAQVAKCAACQEALGSRLVFHIQGFGDLLDASKSTLPFDVNASRCLFFLILRLT